MCRNVGTAGRHVGASRCYACVPLTLLSALTGAPSTCRQLHETLRPAAATRLPPASLSPKPSLLHHPESRLVVCRQVVGQPEALGVVSDAVRVARAGLQPAERPLGVFLFVGPTGVGKTQLCKALARQLFDSEEVR